MIVTTAGDEHAARDALQATLLRLARHARPFDDEAIFWSWLTVLARSALADQRRGRRRYFAFLDRFTRHAAIQSEIDAPRPDADTGDRLDTLLTAQLATLPAADRDLLHWKYRDAVPVRTIAERLNVSEKTIESRLSRLRTRLRADILNRLREPSS